MSALQSILMNVTPQETRVAVLEKERLRELQIERHIDASIVGNLYKGKVTRVLPEMQAAFVDIGQATKGFLPLADLAAASGIVPTPLIENMLHQGSVVWVQVIKDPVGDKGPRLSTHLKLSSRNLIFRPQGSSVGISHKIASNDERTRLKQCLRDALEKHPLKGGFIIRTAAETATMQAIQCDLAYLEQRWQHITNAMQEAKTGSIAHREDSLVLRMLRDASADKVEQITIDSQSAFERVRDFAADFVPEMVEKIALHNDVNSLFDTHAVEPQIDAALQHKVPLASGANLLIEPTESMTTIDVNTAANIGRQKLASGEQIDLNYKTNLQAAEEIAHQLRLRNLGGIIIVDFIDMGSVKHNRAVLAALQLALSVDRVKTTISKMSALGLVEITRQRTRPSLEQILCEDCHVCAGTGRVKTARSICYEILRQIKREARQRQNSSYTVLAAEAVIELLQNGEANSLNDLRESLQRPINLQLEAHYHQQQYEIVLG